MGRLALLSAALCAGLCLSAPVNLRMGRRPGRLPLRESQNTTDVRAQRQHRIEVSKHNLPTSGNIEPLGIFWTQIQIGTPKKEYNVAIDTGSNDLLISLSDCKGCKFSSHSTPFSLKGSSTVKPLPCGNCECRRGKCVFSNTYATCNLKNPDQGCTVSGDLFTDNFGLGGVEGTSTTIFGGINLQTGNFVQLYDVHGIMGVIANQNWGGTTNPIGQLANEGKLQDSSFAMCFNNTGGKLTIGGYDPALSTSPLKYTPIPGNFFYSMTSTGLMIGSSTVPNVPGEVIVDSGTNIFLVPHSLYGAIQQTFQSSYGTLPHVKGPFTWFDGVGSCHPMTSSELAQFPDVHLSLQGGVTLTMHPQNYLLLNSSYSNPTYCYGIYANSEYFILGDTFMTNYYSHFDAANNQIGWAPVNAEACF